MAAEGGLTGLDGGDGDLSSAVAVGGGGALLDVVGLIVDGGGCLVGLGAGAARGRCSDELSGLARVLPIREVVGCTPPPLVAVVASSPLTPPARGFRTRV